MRKLVGRPAGHADGQTKASMEAARVKAREEAERIITIMEEKGLIEATVDTTEATPDANLAREALLTAATVMRLPIAARDKLQAAGLVLNYTKEKPAQSQKVAVSKAEDFLASLLAKEETPS